MKILIIRHGDPDYSIDGLTEKGKREAELLKNRLEKIDIKAVYCSIYGRAKLTIDPTLKAKNMTATYCDWLREFDYARVKLPYLDNEKATWDFLPQYVDSDPLLLTNNWQDADLIKESNVPDCYDNVCKEFDKVLEKHGYKRDKLNYTVTNSNHDTLIFTCHFGLGSILISHLLNCSPFSTLQHTFLAPTSVTTFISEERKEGIASFRASGIGDISHLFIGNEEPSFSGRFCECFNDETRH